MRERLIELLLKLPIGKSESEVTADHLLENGVVVLPIKTGDTIYRCGDPIKKVYEWEIEHIEMYVDEIVYVDDSDNTFTGDEIGKTVFLTREAAENALKEREKG